MERLCTKTTFNRYLLPAAQDISPVKAQRKSIETRQRFASLRETSSRNNALFVQN